MCVSLQTLSCDVNDFKWCAVTQPSRSQQRERETKHTEGERPAPGKEALKVSFSQSSTALSLTKRLFGARRHHQPRASDLFISPGLGNAQVFADWSKRDQIREQIRAGCSRALTWSGAPQH